MALILPTDCGNSPRMALVAELMAAWASGEHAPVQEWLAEGSRWTLVGTADQDDREARGGDQSAADETSRGGSAVVPAPFEAETGEILSVLNHGRLAACDGFLMRGEERVDFCHVIRFAGTGKTSRIREIRTYLQPSDAS
ncbi:MULTISPECIES: hypothetical protein [Brachybacterium]|uniref:hypothetical protein n=1 Tax=Brachybacterium TaxID=43668 RepID=UPI0011448E20|nr:MULTISPECIES: hypothetical protein [Brachybacterium]